MALTRIGNQAITLDAAEIPNLPASKITSGTFADARIAASNVSQHATSFDDNKLVNDISTLGLRVHTQENLSASNTNSASFDTFQDSTAISNLTNTVRASDEFMFSGTEGTPTAYDYNGASPKAKVKFYNMQADNGTWFEIDNDGDTSRAASKYVIPTISAGENGGGFPTYSSGTNGAYCKYDFGSTMDWTLGKYQIGKINTWGDVNQWKFEYSTDDAAWFPVDLSNATQSQITRSPDHDGGSTTTGGTFSNGAADGTANFSQLATNKIYLSNCHLQGIPSLSARYFRLTINSMHGGTSNSNAGWGIFAPVVNNYTTAASGSFTGNNITASSTNKMGAVITYQDHAGTNTLNTDIVLQLSADGGSNYSTATLTALPDFATGIKMCKVNDLSVTAGTSLKYKISFANQSAGSKVARIRGVSLQY